MNTSSSVKSFLRKCVTPVLLLVVWHVCVQQFQLGDGFIPLPTEVVSALYQWITGEEGRYSGNWLNALADSWLRVLCGFGITLAIGAPLGLFIGRSSLMADIQDPLLQLQRPTPTAPDSPW